MDNVNLGAVAVYFNVTPDSVSNDLRLSRGDLLPCGQRGASVAAADLDGDGFAEVLCGSTGNYSLRNGAYFGDLFVYNYVASLQRTTAGGDGAGFFVPLAPQLPDDLRFGSDEVPSIATGDFDGDGLTDIALAFKEYAAVLWNVSR